MTDCVFPHFSEYECLPLYRFCFPIADSVAMRSNSFVCLLLSCIPQQFDSFLPFFIWLPTAYFAFLPIFPDELTFEEEARR